MLVAQQEQHCSQREHAEGATRFLNEADMICMTQATLLSDSVYNPDAEPQAQSCDKARQD